MNAPFDFAGLKPVADHNPDSELTCLCPEHGPYRPIFPQRPICPECAHIQTRAARDSEGQRQLEARLTALNTAAGIPARYEHAGFKNYRTDLAGQRDALTTFANYAKRLIAGEPHTLLITGTTGTGKTHLAVALVRNLIQAQRSARYMTSADVATTLLDAWKRQGDSEAATRKRLQASSLLVVDEYGLDDQDAKRLPAVHRVLYDRYDACKATALVTNLTADALQQSLGHRLWSRLNENGTLLEMNWPDQRAGRML